MTSLAYVAVVDKLYDIMKSDNPKSIPFKFIALFVLKEFVKKGLQNQKFLQYLSEKVCNKLAKWCAEGRNSDDGATLFHVEPSEKGTYCLTAEKVWSKMFYKLALSCFDVWANQFASRHKGLSRFKEKFDVLKSARVEFPENRKLYDEGLAYILGSLKELDISRCDFTEDFSEFPSRIEASCLNITAPQYDNVLGSHEPGTTKARDIPTGTSLQSKPAIGGSGFLSMHKQPLGPGVTYVAGEIAEVVESQEYSEIAAEPIEVDTKGGSDA